MKRYREQLMVGAAAAFVIYLYVGGYLSQRDPDSVFATYDSSPLERMADVLDSGALDRCQTCGCADRVLAYVWDGYGYGYGYAPGGGYGYGSESGSAYGYGRRSRRRSDYGYGPDRARGYGYGDESGRAAGYGYGNESGRAAGYGYESGRAAGYGGESGATAGYGYRSRARRFNRFGYASESGAAGYGYRDRGGYGYFGLSRTEWLRRLRETERFLKNLDCSDKESIRRQRELMRLLRQELGADEGESRSRRGYDRRTH